MSLKNLSGKYLVFLLRLLKVNITPNVVLIEQGAQQPLKTRSNLMKRYQIDWLTVHRWSNGTD